MQRKKLLALAKTLQAAEHWPALAGPRPARGYKLLDDWWTWDKVPRKFTMGYYYVRYYTKDGTKRGIAGGIAAHGFGLDCVGFGHQEYHIDDISEQFAAMFDIPIELSEMLCLPPKRYNEKKDRNDWDYLPRIKPEEAAQAVLAVRGGKTSLRDVWGNMFDRLLISPPRKKVPEIRSFRTPQGEIVYLEPNEQLQEIFYYQMPHNGRRGGSGRKVVDAEIVAIYPTPTSLYLVTRP